MLSRCVIIRRQNRELEKHLGKKEKVEVELHSALVLPEYYLLSDLRTKKGYIAQWTWQGFQRQTRLLLYFIKNWTRYIGFLAF